MKRNRSTIIETCTNLVQCERVLVLLMKIHNQQIHIFWTAQHVQMQDCFSHSPLPDQKTPHCTHQLVDQKCSQTLGGHFQVDAVLCWFYIVPVHLGAVQTLVLLNWWQKYTPHVWRCCQWPHHSVEYHGYLWKGNKWIFYVIFHTWQYLLKLKVIKLTGSLQPLTIMKLPV